MWRCPNCGEQVEPEFEVCWKCGTRQDGTRAEDFQAEASDLAVPDLGPDPEPPQETAEEAAAAKARNERIVELCSAADTVEAQELCNVLQEEGGIQAQVAGGTLANAAGGLPFGETIAPRVWINESDAARAREILARRLAESEEELADWPESDETPPWELPGEPEEGELPSDRRFRFLNQGFWIAGLACIALGSVWAWQNATIRSEHSVATTGRRVDHATYAYMVDGKTYSAVVKNAPRTPATVTIYYNPHEPWKCIVGPIAPPWVVLAFAFGLAAFLAFVGYEFR